MATITDELDTLSGLQRSIQRLLSEGRSPLIAQLISESYNNSYNRIKITPRGGVIWSELF